MRRWLPLALLLAPTVASAQTTPSHTQGVAPAGWSRDASTLTSPEGRVRRAWSLDAWAPGDTAADRARGFLAREAHRLALPPTPELVQTGAHEAHGLSTVRFAWAPHGAAVLGATVVVRLIGDRVDYVGVDGFDVSLAPSRRTLSAEDAVRRALAPGERALETTPAWLPLAGRAVPVWIVDTAGQHMAQQRRVYVHAARGEVLASHERSAHALGRIYATNPRTDMDVTTDVDLPNLTSNDRITGRYFRVFNCNFGTSGCQPTQLAVADMNGDFLYDPEEPSDDDPFAEVHTYFHADRVAQYFRDTHSFTWECGTETLMRVFVNYREVQNEPYSNAAYSPGTRSDCGFMFFGQGAQDFSYDADVVYHEFGHAVVDQVTNLGFFFTDPLGVSFDPQAVNEGVADYFAATLSDDPAMAEYFDGAGLGGEGALRNLDNDFVCPNDLAGEGHFDGRIWAAVGWDIRSVIGAEKADALIFSAISAVPMTVSLGELAEVVSASAASLQTAGVLDASDVATVESVLSARGLTGCERIVPLDDEEPKLGFGGQGTITASTGGLAPNRYRLDVPADATSVVISVRNVSVRRGEYTLHASTGAPPRARIAERPPLRADADFELDVDGRVVITRDGEYPLPRCETMYLGLVTTNLATIGQAVYQIQASVERSGEETACPSAEDAGVDGGGADAGMDGTPAGGGCSCRAGGSSSTSPRWALLLLAVLFYRRRR